MFTASDGGDDRCLSEQDSRRSGSRDNLQRFKSVRTLGLAWLGLVLRHKTYILLNCLFSRSTELTGSSSNWKYSEIAFFRILAVISDYQGVGGMKCKV